jgi:predicted benzoate:H+ symporter BenE
MTLIKDLSASAVIAGFVTVLVGSPARRHRLQAAHARCDTAEIGSWMWALGLGKA